MIKYTNQLVQFKLNYQLHEKAKKEAQKRGYSSAGVYSKALLTSALENDQQQQWNEDILQYINELKDELERIGNAVEREQKQQEKFRKTIEESLISILEQMRLDKNNTNNAQKAKVSTNGSSTKRPKESPINRYPNRRG